MNKKRGLRHELIGIVKSDKMDKTISVLVERRVKHKRYKKYILKNSTMKAHDEKNQAQKGDRVLIYETRPLSKTKRWKLSKVLVKEEGKSYDTNAVKA